ncbi:MAG: hypothetical protein ACI84R_001367 [Candidatus Azotimanducaceae bacterium]|jgi:hypothetical protein
MRSALPTRQLFELLAIPPRREVFLKEPLNVGRFDVVMLIELVNIEAAERLCETPQWKNSVASVKKCTQICNHCSIQHALTWNCRSFLRWRFSIQLFSGGQFLQMHLEVIEKSMFCYEWAI